MGVHLVLIAMKMKSLLAPLVHQIWKPNSVRLASQDLFANLDDFRVRVHSDNTLLSKNEDFSVTFADKVFTSMKTYECHDCPR